MTRVKVAVIGGGPAGLAAAIAASDEGASVLLIERDARLGGALKQSIQDAFGFLRHDVMLTGPEYAFRNISTLYQTNCVVLLQTFVTRINRVRNAFHLTLSNRHGIVQVEADTVVLATGGRELTSKQAGVHGARPAGVFTAGTAQYFTNVMGQLPTNKCVIFGSHNIGLVMARQLALEGADVIGVYERYSEPIGSPINITHCLSDYNIPIHFNHTVTRVFGAQRVRGVEVCQLDKKGFPVKESGQAIRCDSLLISVGLVPENKLADSIGVPNDVITQGPLCDQTNMTMIDGIFSCGNSLHITNPVDYISESGRNAGTNAARFMTDERALVKINISKEFLSVVPQYIDINRLATETALYFRTSRKHKNANVQVSLGSEQIHTQKFDSLRPFDTNKLKVSFDSALSRESNIQITLGGDEERQEVVLK